METISQKQSREIKALRPTNRRRLIQFIIAISLFAAIVSLIPGKNRLQQEAKRQSQSIDAKEQFRRTTLSCVEWFANHGTSLELALFESAAKTLTNKIDIFPENSLVLSIILPIFQGLIRVIFIILASIRLWILCIGWGIYVSIRRFKPYLGADLLGETGIGKLYYSGIRVDLSKTSKSGAPDKLVTNLATLRRTQKPTVAQEKLLSVLRTHKILNETTRELCSTVCAYPEVPFFAPPSEVSTQVASTISLVDATITLLQNALSQNDPYIDRVLKPFDDAIESVHLVEVATVILSIQCAKAMGYLKEGNRWVRRSSYLNLNARSVLHSIPSFEDEFNFEERARIRQALVYGPRFSVFGPIRLPIELPLSTRALRQIVELLIGEQYKIEHTVDEIELYGMSFVAYQKFELELFDRIAKRDPSIVDNAIAVESGLFCLPIKQMVDLFSKVISKEEEDRFSFLIEAVSKTQFVPITEEEFKGPLPRFQKIFAPITKNEIASLSKLLSLDSVTLNRWSIYRNILNSFGWLARQVGSTSVPEHSAMLMVFKGASSLSDSNREMIAGRKGYVPCRSTSFERRLGKQWRVYFKTVDRALAADNIEMFEKFLTGYDPTDDFAEDDSTNIS